MNWPATYRRRTVISSRVNVPVLSVQITDVLPSVSTAASRRIRARRRTRRCTPSASEIVTTAGQGFRHHGDRERDAEHQHLDERLAAHEAERDDQCHDRDRGPRQLAPQLVEVHLQRRAADLDVEQHLRDAAEFRARPGRRHHGQAAAVRQDGPREHHVASLGDRSVGCIERVGVLRDRRRLAGEGRLLRLQVDRPHQPAVGGDAVACVEHEQVAGHHVPRRQLDLLAVTDDGGARGRHLPQRIDGALGAELLHEAEQHGEQHDHRDRDGFDDVPEQRRQCSRHQQDDDQHVAELRGEQPPRRGPVGGLQHVRADALEPTSRFVRRQAAAARPEAANDLVRGLRVPRLRDVGHYADAGRNIAASAGSRSG